LLGVAGPVRLGDLLQRGRLLLRRPQGPLDGDPPQGRPRAHRRHHGDPGGRGGCDHHPHRAAAHGPQLRPAQRLLGRLRRRGQEVEQGAGGGRPGGTPRPAAPGLQPQGRRVRRAPRLADRRADRPGHLAVARRRVAAHRRGPRPRRRADGAALRAGRVRRLDLPAAGRDQQPAGRVRLRPVLIVSTIEAPPTSAPVTGEPFNAAEWLVTRHARATPDKRAITALDLDGSVRTLSYAELDDAVHRFAAALVGAGVRPEERLLLCMGDTPELLTAFLAGLRIGAVPVPVSTMLKPHDIRTLATDSRARLLVLSEEFLELAP